MFLESFDHPARDVVRVGSLAFVFAGTLDLDDLRVAALAANMPLNWRGVAQKLS